MVPADDPFLDYMTSHWAPPAAVHHQSVPLAATYAARRRKLSEALPGQTLVIPAGKEQVRANDTHYRFRVDSDYYYLTGSQEPDDVLVIDANGEATLYAAPNEGKSKATFYTDRDKGELWVGPRPGLPELQARLGVRTRDIAQLQLQPLPPTNEPKESLAEKQQQMRAAISQLRLIKDEGEVAALRAAIARTERAFYAVARLLPRLRTERDVEAIISSYARRYGNDVGYNTIAAAGAHACILHWTRNNGPLHAGDLLLIDAGVEGRQLYTADITRTLPINGRYSLPQRQVVDLVHGAQQAALAKMYPGQKFTAPHKAAMQHLAEGLLQLGVFTSVAQVQDTQLQPHRRYTLHGVSHMLGLDVHDCPHAPKELYRDGELQPGMVLTCEPGLYFQPDDLTVPEHLRGIGVRLEDDVLITEEGPVLLTSLPRSAAEIERWMAQAQAE